MARRGDYGVCNVCPKSKDCYFCSPKYRNELNQGRDSDDGVDLIGLAVGVATGVAVDELVEDVFDFFS